MEIRLQKYLAEVGVASRRTAEKYIEDGRVRVNGHIINNQGVKINPEKDKVEFDGKVVELDKRYKYYMLHKPVRYVTTASDEKGRATVLDLLPVKERVYPIGRLDYMSSGLLLLTNDGDLTYRLTHPKHLVDKKYVAIVEPKVNVVSIERLKQGVDLGIYKTSPSQIKLLKETATSQTYEVTIHEGKNRQIRRMFEHIGTRVKRLKRISIGDLELGNLESGKFRTLTEKEIKYLKSL